MCKLFTSTTLVGAFMVLASGLATAQTRPPVPGPDTGPKKRIAVSKFDAVGTFVAQYGGWDIGGALAAQLTTELARTGRFIVVERPDLADVLHEQELGLVGVTAPETAAQAGLVLGAQLLVRGTVTEFEQSASGTGAKIGFGFGPATIGLGGSKTTGQVVIDLRLIDATTGQVLESHRAEARVSQRALGADLSVGSLTLGNTAFARTPLGEATRQATAQAVAIVAGRMEVMPWTARIVEISDQDVYVNAGRDANLAPGQRFVVSTLGKPLVDPATGLALGAPERQLGRIEIQSVEDKFSVARMLDPMRIARGDLVRVASANSASVAPTARATAAPATSIADVRQLPSADVLRQVIQELNSAAATNVGGGFPMSPVPAFPSMNAAGPLAAPMSMPGSDPSIAPALSMPGGTTLTSPGVVSSASTTAASAGWPR